jgi:carbamoyl-phosphate synthase large subunit
MLELCAKEKINLIIPLMDLDTMVFSDNRPLFEEKQITLLLAPSETIEICKDKYNTQLSLKENELPTPETILFSDIEEASLHYPLLLKPRFLSMKNSPDYFLKLISNGKDLRYCEEKLKGKEQKFMLQEYLTGKEITIDFFVDKDNRVISVVPGERIQANAPAFSSHGGAIVRGKTFHSKTLTNLILRVAKKFKFFGPANLQGYSQDGKRIKFTEINPRFTGATVMTEAAGADFFKWSIDLALDRELTPQIGKFQEIYMTSWNKPVFLVKPRF